MNHSRVRCTRTCFYASPSCRTSPAVIEPTLDHATLEAEKLPPVQCRQRISIALSNQLSNCRGFHLETLGYLFQRQNWLRLRRTSSDYRNFTYRFLTR